MAGNELWVGALTAVTALGASFLSSRGASRAALAQARTTTISQALAQERDRRRAAYRDLMTCVHSFMAICWRLREVDEAPDHRTKLSLMTQIHERMGQSVSEITRATREVLLDGPADVAVAAEQVRLAALRTQRQFESLARGDDPELRRTYDQVYGNFRDQHVAFIELARNALETKPGK
ncbi:hypothetical protein [Actinoplanes cyaneus]|uniref:hypothetical protein n=1 Tax=Actinoplanes cyaneus TaxID=52696 RepID=UPI0019455990|nr:hypothetical protein [Actinoplanes cyaneus]MCW2137977.1 hypothetical protein [Actinoplanes cyaneus]